MTCRFLFEQSGTFKYAAKAFGYDAYDYDICDDFGVTDYKVDLFSEITRAVSHCESIFDGFAPGDLVFAFFPCVRFSNNFELLVTCHAHQYMDLSDLRKCDVALSYHRELAYFYYLITSLVKVCLDRGFSLVIENPYKGSYLARYWPFAPSVIVRDRRDYGDAFEKPTGFWFFGFPPFDNALLWPKPNYPKLRVRSSRGFARSRISPYFAAFFLASHCFPGYVCDGFDVIGYLDNLPEYLR